MRLGVTALCVSLAACGFSAPQGASGDDVTDGPAVDARAADARMGAELPIGVDGSPQQPDAMITPDAPDLCGGTGMITVCFHHADIPMDDFTATGTPQNPQVFDSDQMCTTMLNVNGVMTCVIARHNITIPATTYVRGAGSHPLVIFASGDITVAGQISLANRTGSPAAGVSTANCTAAAGENTTNGGGGGAGGSFADAGGSGGFGDGTNADGGTATAGTARAFHAGCSGGQGGNGNAGAGALGGAGGLGGGAAYLIAVGAITVAASGVINATGDGGIGGTSENNNGGRAGAGGGGGSGGFLGFDATAVALKGSVLATGGGGGEGASYMRADGEDGSPGSLDVTKRAHGGTQGTNLGGNGGTGSGPGILNFPANRGETGDSSDYGGGGGGGAAGFIYVHGTTLDTGGAMASPAIVN